MSQAVLTHIYPGFAIKATTLLTYSIKPHVQPIVESIHQPSSMLSSFHLKDYSLDLNQLRQRAISPRPAHNIQSHEYRDFAREYPNLNQQFKIDTPQDRLVLEQFWTGLSLRERAIALGLLRKKLFHDCIFHRHPYLPEGAVFLFQLFGKTSPLEIGLFADHNRMYQTYEYHLCLGKEMSVDPPPPLSAGYLLGHTHPKNIFPSDGDLRFIESNLDQKERHLQFFGTSFYVNDALPHMILSPLGGSHILAEREKTGVWRWRRTRNRFNIMWATRPGVRDSKLLVSELRHIRAYLTRHFKKDRLVFTRIPWERLLDTMAQRFTLQSP